MLKKSVIVLFIAFSNLGLYAQFGYGKVEDIEALRERTLLVEIKQANEKKLKKLRKKPEELEAYKLAIDSYNNAVKKAFENKKIMSNNLEFVTIDKIEEYSKNKKQRENYGYFKTFVRTRSMSSSFGGLPMYTYEIGLLEEKKPIYSMQFESFSSFNEADAIFIYQQISQYFDGRIKKEKENLKRKDIMNAFKENSKRLKGLTLYIDENLMSENLKSEMKSLYKYEFKIVDKSVIDQAIVNKTEGIAYVKALPIAQASSGSGFVKVSKQKYMQLFVDAKNGETLAYVAPGMGVGIIGGGNSKLSVGDMKGVLSMME